jgi:hypothetical protein
MTPSDSHLSRLLKEHPAGKQFANASDVQQTVVSWLKILDTNFFHAVSPDLVSQWYKYLNTCDNYKKKFCIAKPSCNIHTSM